MKRKFLVYALASLIGVSALGVGIASAHGFGGPGMFWGLGSSLTIDELVSRQQTMFEKEAQILGLSTEEVKNAWAEGKTIKQIMQEKGINQDQVQQRLKDMQIQQLKDQLKALVDKGLISQAQADKRLEFMQNHLANGNGKQMGKMLHMGLGF